VSRFIILQGLLDNGCLTGRRRVFILGNPGQGDHPTNELADLNYDVNPDEYDVADAHRNAAILNEALVYELSERYQDARVFGLKPGLIIQPGARQTLAGGKRKTGLAKFFDDVRWKVVAVTPETYVARALVPLIESEALDNVSARMYDQKGREIQSRGWVADEKNRAKAWNISVRLVTEAEYRAMATQQVNAAMNATV